jgi:hypothetical protein
MTRSRTLEAVSGVERRLRAEASVAAALSTATARQRGHNRAEFARDITRFNVPATRSAFACAVTAAHRATLSLAEAMLALRQQAADEALRAACEAVLPWAQIRCGLERRRARLAAKSYS